MSVINDNTACSSLREQAFSVFCDVTAEDAAAKTKQMRLENEKTAPLLDQLQNVKIFEGNKEIASVEVLSYDAEDETYFIYQAKDTPSVAHDHLKWLGCRCNGLLVRPDEMTYPHLKIQDNEIKATYNISDQLLVMGKLINHEGTLNDVQQWIAGFYPLIFQMIGLVDNDTGRPLVENFPFFARANNVLEGSTFVLENVCLAKYLVLPTLDASTMALDDTLEELKDAAKISLGHKGLTLACKDYAFTKKKMISHQSARALLQSVCGCAAGQLDNPLFRLKLEGGTVSRMLLYFEGGVSPLTWSIEQNATMLLSSLADLQLTIAGVSVCTRFDLLRNGPFLREGVPGFTLKYENGWEIEAVFGFDESADRFLAEDGEELFFRRIEYTLLPSDVVMNGLTRLPGMTVRLISLDIKLDQISPRLDALGIEYDASSINFEYVEAGQEELE